MRYNSIASRYFSSVFGLVTRREPVSLCALFGAFIILWMDGTFGQPGLDPLRRSIFEYYTFVYIEQVEGGHCLEVVHLFAYTCSRVSRCPAS